MKKIVVALAAVTAVCACSLVIDPDKLVEGNASPTGDGDASLDVSTASDVSNDADPIPVVPECVPQKPIGTEGPYAVVTAVSDTPPTCPSGYLPTPAHRAKGNFTAEPVQCSTTTGCTCANNGGTPTCGLRIRYFNGLTCLFVSDAPQTLGASCVDMESSDSFRVEYTATGVSCSNNGPATTSPSSMPEPKFGSTWVACTPDPAVKTASCGSGQTALPPASGAAACIAVSSGAPCPAPYGKQRDLSKSGNVNDTRTCSCSCGPATSVCSGGTATAFSSGTCGGTGTPVTIGQCRALGSADGMRSTPPTVNGAGACEAKATPSGMATADNDLRLCCL